MTLNQIYDWTKKAWAVIALAGVLGGLGYSTISVRNLAIAADKRSKSAERQIAKINSIIISDQSKLEGYMEMLGIDPDNARQWSKMPKECPTDSAGQPVLETPWLHVVGDFEALMLYRLDSDTVLYYETLWVAKDDY